MQQMQFIYVWFKYYKEKKFKIGCTLFNAYLFIFVSIKI